MSADNIVDTTSAGTGMKGMEATSEMEKEVLKEKHQFSEKKGGGYSKAGSMEKALGSESPEGTSVEYSSKSEDRDS